MKNFLLPITCILGITHGLLFGQNCLPEGITFERQSQIDSFSIHYPGCTVIEGDVCIGDCELPLESSDITNLDGLSQLTSIKGKIIMSNNHQLTSLVGLQNLTVFEDDVRITYSYALSSLEGLNQVRLMKGSFTLEFISGLESITGFENLDTILGTLRMTYLWDLTSVTAFSNLKHLGGYEINGLGGLTMINDMNNLSYLGNFKIVHNAQLTSLPQFPLVSVINGNFDIDGNVSLPRIYGYENIKRVEGNLTINAAGSELIRGTERFTLDAFHELTYVGGRFSFFAERLDTLDGFKSLDTIVGSLGVHGSLGFHNFPQHNQFKYIGGDISFVSLNWIEGLGCLSSLEQLNGLTLASCPNLLDLSAIHHVDSLHGELELSRMDFSSLADLANLTSIDGNLRIYDCNSLLNLSGLENLSSINGHIFIYRNQNLESLEGIQNIDPASIQATGNNAIYLSQNPRLSLCAVESICSALRDLKRSYFIENNDQGCDDVSQIDCVAYGLSGTVFFDENQDGIFDNQEIGIPGIPVRIQPGDAIAVSNSEGRYIAYADEGEQLKMTIEQSADWILTSDSLSFTDIYEEGNPENSAHYFGLIPAYDWYELSSSLTSNPVRCNQNVHFFLHWRNGSTKPLDGRIVLQYDDLVTFVNATFPPTQHNSTTREMVWVLDSLPLFTEQDSRITFSMPDESFVGQPMEFIVDAYRDSSGAEILMSHVDYTPLVTCAVDPNDKHVMPAGQRDEKYVLREDELTYTVRFENLGNAEAIDITVVDTLDGDFDMQSFKVIDSSFPALITLDGNVVTFLFLNIWLPAKGTGFVTYQVKPKETVEDHTQVENKADIVFDFNQPIITNKTIQTVVNEICENVTFTIDTVICDGGPFMGITEPGTYYDTISIGSTCDSITIIHVDFTGPVIIEIDTAICEGEFFAGHNTSGVFTYDSIDVVTGCASIVILTLEVLPLGEGPCITSTKDPGGDDLLVYPNPVNQEVFVEATFGIESVRILTIESKPLSLRVISNDSKRMTIQLEDNLPEGMYLLEVNTVSGQKYIRKLIVE